ncbi:DUF4397 domain-containing protein [Mucilaginibacter arboris]|uniref:DUF4397 domain-containing protein n=1 Tax=Mucilaginibacter arboris TaxID=2682090 RepID=A0A7K1SUY1_9SPHI|nr:DUF4397 domain-containing protein [Mucilaginibacter arboris]MVN21048.1 DUF4397 domain-containing protein [Mucilaginibacter arboris]
MKKLRLFLGRLMVACIGLIVFSCNNSGVSPTNYSRLQVINTLAGSTPINFSLNSTKKNSTSITFPGTSGYVTTTPGMPYLQIALATTPGVYFYNATLNLKTDSSYSVFITGTTQPQAYTSVFTWDDLSSPSIGKAKVRFVNASLSSTNLDVTINAVAGFTNVAFKGVGKFVEVPAGTYEFRAYSTGSTSSSLAILSNQVLADGKVYTLYAQGVVGNTATTSAFGLSLISNLLPNTK